MIVIIRTICIEENEIVQLDCTSLNENGRRKTQAKV